MTFNKELAERAIKSIEANPEEWNQENWRCETGMCFAGHVAMAAGAAWNHPEELFPATVRTLLGKVMHVSRFALEELGLEEDEGDFHEFFSVNNTLDDLKALIEKYSKE